MRHPKSLTALACTVVLLGSAVSPQAANLTTVNNQTDGTDWTATATWRTNGAGTLVGPPVAGNTYECIYNGVAIGNNKNNTRLRSPKGATQGIYNFTFPGDSLTLDTNTSIRYCTGTQGSLPHYGGTNTFPGPASGGAGLIFNGGMMQIRLDNMTANLAGVIRANDGTLSYFSTANNDAGPLQPDANFFVNGQLTGGGALAIVGGNASNTNLFSCATNTFSGQWIVQGGYLMGSVSGALGTNSITLDSNYVLPWAIPNTVAALEVNYDLNSAGVLIITNKSYMVLHQECSFGAAIIKGTVLSLGRHPYSELSASFPTNFAAGGSGSITIQPYGTPPSAPTITSQPGPQTVFSGQRAQFTVGVNGTSPLSFQWRAGTNGVYGNLTDGGNISGSATETLTISNTTPANPTNYIVVIANAQGSVTSSVATLTVTPLLAPTITIPPGPQSLLPGLTAQFTVGASGTPPFYYQWRAGTNGVYGNLADGGSIAGSTTATLTISSVSTANPTNYVVVITNVVGSVTSSVATLTVLPPGPPQVITLSGQQPSQTPGLDWNSPGWWSDGQPASVSVQSNPGSTYEVLPNGRLRTTLNAAYAAFPGAILQVDGNGVLNNGTVGEIRFKQTTAGAGTVYFPRLVMNGGQLDVATGPQLIIAGEMDVLANTPMYNDGGNNYNFGCQIDSWLTGTGTIEYHAYNVPFTNAYVFDLNITGTSNTFSGRWNVVTGGLLGSGLNSLGTNSITVGINGMLETAYDIASQGSLFLNGRMYLHQNDTFANVIITNGSPLAAGTYSFAQLNAAYPSNFPASWPQLVGSAVSNASGSITVLMRRAALALSSSARTNGYLAPLTFTAAVQTSGVTAADATGTVIFQANGAPWSTNALVNGATSATVSSLPRGINVITAIYGGDGNYFAATNTLAQLVTNHPPVAANLSVSRLAGSSLKIALSDIAATWYDADGDGMALTSVTWQTTNGVTLLPSGVTTNLDGSYVITDTARLYYENSVSVTDQFRYNVTDSFGATSIGYVNILVSGSDPGANSIASITGTNPKVLTAYGIPGLSYIVERATDVSPAVWVDISTNIAATNGLIQATDSFSDLGGNTPDAAFYRLKYQP